MARLIVSNRRLQRVLHRFAWGSFALHCIVSCRPSGAQGSSPVLVSESSHISTQKTESPHSPTVAVQAPAKQQGPGEPFDPTVVPAEQGKVPVALSSTVPVFFPPAAPGPAYERTAQDGDGEWRAFFHGAGARTAQGRLHRQVPEDYGIDLVRRMVLHPHFASPFQSMVIAVFDLTRLRLSHRPGVQDVKDMGKNELIARAGLVPEAEQTKLFALFNGGFQPRHGRWGMFSLQSQIVPPREDACTVAILSDGRVKIVSWPQFQQIAADVVAYRQTPPCLALDGKMHPRLQKRDRRAWGGQNDKRKTRRRSAVGVSADGSLLFYALGEETEPEVLAAGLLHAGAEDAAQLDINWNWTRLFLYQETAQGIESVGSLQENMAKATSEYIRRPAQRGFFYLTTREVK